MGQTFVGAKPRNRRGKIFDVNNWGYNQCLDLIEQTGCELRIWTSESEAHEGRVFAADARTYGKELRAALNRMALASWPDKNCEGGQAWVIFIGPDATPKKIFSKSNWASTPGRRRLTPAVHKRFRVQNPLPKEHDDWIKHFIGFLENCGGFRVY